MSSTLSDHNLECRGLTSDFRENSFDVIRLIAACIVMLSHSFRHFGFPKPSFLLFFTEGAYGVMIMFAMSGYLTFASYERECSAGNGRSHAYIYIYKRICRIYPLFIASVFMQLVLDACSGLKVFSFYYLVRMAKNILLFTGQNAAGGIPNGVLWTMRSEILVYLLIPIFYRTLKKLTTRGWLLLIFCLWQFNLWDAQIIAYTSEIPLLRRMSYISCPVYFLYEFAIGMFLYCKWEVVQRILKNWKVVVGGIALFAIWNHFYTFEELIPHTGAMHNPFFGLFLPFLTIGAGYAFGNHRLKLDISYEVYLFHMLVIGTMLKLPPPSYGKMFLCWGIVLLFSVAVSRLMELPMRKLLKFGIKFIQERCA